MEASENYRLLTTTIRQPQVTRFTSNKPLGDCFGLHSNAKNDVANREKSINILRSVLARSLAGEQLARFITHQRKAAL
jgi:hypothetical protein